MTTAIFLDEAGYTGPYMNDPNQPVFILAAHSVPEDRCKALLSECFGKVQAPEIKHTNVRKGSGQKGVIKLWQTLQAEGHKIVTYGAHKHFVLLVRLFDWLVEPEMHRTGFNAYDRQFNIKYCNTAYVCLNTFEGRQFLIDLLAAFETMMRERTPANYKALWKGFDKAYAAAKPSSRQLLDIIAVGKGTSLAELLEIPPDALDLAFPTTVAVVGHWRRASEGPFQVVHDQSSDMAKRKDLWDWLTSPNQQQTTLGFGDYRYLPLPMNVTSTIAGNSKDHAGLQVADVLAGATYEVCRRVVGAPCDEVYADRLIAAGLNRLTDNMWPEANWTPPAAKVEGAMEDPLDFTARNYFAAGKT